MSLKNKALWVRLVPKPGQEEEVATFLKGGLALVEEEPLTITWYAIDMGDGTYGIFDTFEGDEGRDAHLAGRVAEALMARAGALFAEAPSIRKIDLVAAK